MEKIKNFFERLLIPGTISLMYLTKGISDVAESNVPLVPSELKLICIPDSAVMKASSTNSLYFLKWCFIINCLIGF